MLISVTEIAGRIVRGFSFVASAPLFSPKSGVGPDREWRWKRQYLNFGGASATLGTIPASGLVAYPSGVEADAFARVGIEGNGQ
jgi:hypothetical protein